MGLWNKPSIPGKITPGNNKIPGIGRVNQIIQKVQHEIVKIKNSDLQIPKTITPKIKRRKQK